MNPLRELELYGQSVWLDYIRRGLITTGELHRLVHEDNVRGVTSNPAIFEKAVTGSTDYTSGLEALRKREDLDARGLYEQLAIRDIQDAADVLRPVYDATDRRDGYVSLEVSPYLARETGGTVTEARRLWAAVARDNLMIKVPGTVEGIPAIEQLISEGINVNVTLLFAVEAYEGVAEAYLKGLERLRARGGDVRRVASVASFFVSRIDSAIDNVVNAKVKLAASRGEQAQLRRILGKVAIANAKLAYQRYKEIRRGARWTGLAAQGARPQRLLWASTGTKNPNYRDVIYIEELVGPDTVNTMPPATLEAFREHGRARPSLEADLERAHDTMDLLEQVGISMRAVTDQLLEDGIKLFADAFDKLLDAVEKRCKVAVSTLIGRQTYRLPEELAADVRSAIRDWRDNDKVRPQGCRTDGGGGEEEYVRGNRACLVHIPAVGRSLFGQREAKLERRKGHGHG